MSARLASVVAVVLLFVGCMATPVRAESDKALLASGRKVYIERVDGKDIHRSMEQPLSEWGRWTVVSDRTQADLVVRLHVSTSKFKGDSLAASIVSLPEQHVLWTSTRHKAVGNAFHGFKSPFGKAATAIVEEMKASANNWLQ